LQTRKGVILLSTLFFIFSISILILENLKDSEKFSNEVFYDIQLAQLKITKENVQSEVISTLNKNRNYIYEILEKVNMIPLTFGEINVVINLENVEKKRCNINEIKIEEDIFTKCGEVISNNISSHYKFVEELNKLNISTSQQLKYFIKNYKESVNDEQIDLIKDHFDYRTFDKNSIYVKCSYDINVENNIKGDGSFIFKIGDTVPSYSYFTLKE